MSNKAHSKNGQNCVTGRGSQFSTISELIKAMPPPRAMLIPFAMKGEYPPSRTSCFNKIQPYTLQITAPITAISAHEKKKRCPVCSSVEVFAYKIGRKPTKPTKKPSH